MVAVGIMVLMVGNGAVIVGLVEVVEALGKEVNRTLGRITLCAKDPTQTL